MSLIDRVRMLAGRCTVQQARAAVAEIYRQIGEGTLMADKPHTMAAALLDAARAMVQLNAADAVDDITPDATPEVMAELPGILTELVKVDTTPDLVVHRCAVCGRALWERDTTTGSITRSFVYEWTSGFDGIRCSDGMACGVICHYLAVEKGLSS